MFQCQLEADTLIPFAFSLSAIDESFGYSLRMADTLTAFVVSRTVLDGEIQAEVILIEPNGDEHTVSCTSFSDGHLEVTGDGEMLDYLNDRYTPQGVSRAVRDSISISG